jgi:hypothetical protein
MAYYPDLSPYTYSRIWGDQPILNVGWLDTEHTYSQGTVPDPFWDRLWTFCRQPVFRSYGSHGCGFCQTLWRPIYEQREDETLNLSSAQVRVVDQDGTVYAAPDLIYHYVVAHHYRPPEKFIQAVMETPLPGTQEYEALKKEKWLDTDVVIERTFRGMRQRRPLRTLLTRIRSLVSDRGNLGCKTR